jgi:hypothetical protein
MWGRVVENFDNRKVKKKKTCETVTKIEFKRNEARERNQAVKQETMLLSAPFSWL